jgi:hypothetical protein
MDLKSFQIVSLLDVYRLYAADFADAYRKFLEMLQEIEAQYQTPQGPRIIPYPDPAKEIHMRVNRLLDECVRAGLQSAPDRGEYLKHIGEPGHEPEKYPVDRIRHEMIELNRAVENDLTNLKFFVLGKDTAKYYKLKHPFGEAVYQAFESARHDAREAKNCYTLDRHTACVFHCMRVLEKGLHALVHHLNNAHSARIVFSKTVEETNWGNIIDEIQIALENPKRTRRLSPLPDTNEMRFYAKLSLEFDYFNEAWRKDVSHSRSSYDETSAKSVMDHVERFMRQLVEGLLVRAKISVDSTVMDQALDDLELAVQKRGYMLKPFLQSGQVLAQLISVPSSPSSTGLACDYRIGFKLSDVLLIYVPTLGTGNRNSGTPID